MNNPMQMINAFNQFRSQFNGDPKQKVQELVASGQMSQQQLNQLQAKATEIVNLFRSMGIRF